MHNDHLQGILFNKPELLDLTRRGRRNRFMRKVSAAREGLLSRSPQTESPRSTGPYAISKNVSNKQYTAAIGDLQRRFKHYDSDF